MVNKIQKPCKVLDSANLWRVAFRSSKTRANCYIDVGLLKATATEPTMALLKLLHLLNALEKIVSISVLVMS